MATYELVKRGWPFLVSIISQIFETRVQQEDEPRYIKLSTNKDTRISNFLSYH